jgi:hypothetical protein
MKPFPSCYLILALLMLAPGLNAAAIAPLIYWGPVSLAKGEQLELCSHLRSARPDHSSAERPRALFTFVRIRDGKTVRKEFTLDASRGGCFSMPQQKLGDEPIFAMFQHSGARGDGHRGDGQLLASIAVVGTRYQMLAAQSLETGQIPPSPTVFGPLRLGRANGTAAGEIEDNGGQGLRVCSHNLDATNTTTVTIRFYDARYASRPLFERREVQLQPAEGICVSVNEAQLGDRSIFAEVWSESQGVGISSTLLSGASITGAEHHQAVPPNALQDFTHDTLDRDGSGSNAASPYCQFYRPQAQAF